MSDLGTDPASAPGVDGPFSLERGRDGGLTDDQMRHPRWARDFAGVRAFDEAQTPEELARAYAAKMHPEGFFSHTTAALLHGVWLPLELQRRMEVHVSVPPWARAPRDRRVKGHHLIERPGLVRTKEGLRVASLRETICQLATVLGLDDLVIAAESAMAKNRPDRIPLWSLAAAVGIGDRPRQPMLERMLVEAREGVRSARETTLRRRLVAAGLPEPEINRNLYDADGRWVAERDLVWLLQRVIVEYDGEAHFTEGAQRRDDLRRDRLLTALGWIVIRVSKDDMDRRWSETLEFIRSTLAARS